MTYSATVLADSPVGYWRLGDTGTTAVDLGSGGHSGTISSTGVTKSVTGALTGDSDTAMSFDGTAGKVSGSVQILSATDNWTLEAWLKPTVPHLSGLAVYMGDDGGGYGMGVGATSDGTGSYLFVLYGGVAWFSTGYTFTDSNWHHCVVERVGGTLKAWVDGVQTGGDPAYSTSNAPSPYWAIGGEPGSGTRFYQGGIDEVAVYATALTSTRIGAHYTAGTTSSGTAASASGSLSLAGTATAKAPASASGSLSLAGSATAVPTFTVTATPSGANVLLSWPSRAGSGYVIERDGADIVFGYTGTSYTDTPGSGSHTYRVGVLA